MAAQLDDGDDDFAEAHEINVTPFIDVMLVLLIIFMVAAPLATVDVSVDLPASTAQPLPRPDKPIFVTLKADQTLTLADQPILPAALAAGLDTASGNDRTQPVFLRADKTVAYSDLMATMDTLRQAGYLHIGLVAAQSQ